MKKHFTNLRMALVGILVCLMSLSMMAQTVTLDFTTNDWGFPTASKAVAQASFTNTDGYTIILEGSTGNGYRWYENYQYLLNGQTGATLTLPAFDFAVERIEVVGREGASTATQQNIFVGDVAVSTATTGAAGTNEYLIDENYQAAGNIYVLKVLNNKNTQITFIKIYAVATPEPPTPIVVAVPTFDPEAGTYTAAQNVTISCTTEDAAIYYTLDGAAPTANSTLYENAIEITETTTINAIAILGETISEMATATYTINVTPDDPTPDDPTVLELDSIATLPYTNNFDEGTDPYFMINNGEATNKWYIGQAQGFDNNKLYISSNGGTTNKYDITAASTVTAYRDVVIPETGAVLTFDYRVNGQTNTTDYLMVDLNGTEIARLVGENDWASFSYDISGEMAGEVRVQFTWVNNASAGNQFPAAIDNISIIETPCSQPTALAAAVDSTTAVITWEAVEGQTAWNFQYKLADHSEWYTVPATATTVTLNDLQGNSNYEMRVQAVCGENVSAWTTGTFVVACQTEEVTVTPTDVVIGTGTSTTNYLFPGYYGWQYTAQLYEMSQYGVINSIGFYLNTASSTTGSTMTVWVKAVDANYALASSNTFNNMLDGAQQIFDGTPDFSREGWITFPINNFSMEDGQNLLVLVRGVGCTTSGGCTKYNRYTSASNKLWYKRTDSSDPGQDVTGSLSSYRPNITINMDVTVVTCDDQIACVAPTALEVSDITPNSAVLTWTAGDENQTFNLEYMAEGATEWTSVVVNDTTYTMTELAQLTNYSVRVKAVCGTNNWSDLITASFRTIGICLPVANLETSNVSNTTTLTWEPGGEENAWLVQFKPASEGDDAWTSINVSLIPMTTFGGLVGNVDYDVRVKALCDPENEENQSEWAITSFHSGCAAFDIPFIEEFSTTYMPTCWENRNFYFSSSSYAYSYTNGAELITPAINIPAENSTYLTFEVRGAGEYTVMASYRGTRADRFEEIYTGTAPDQNANIIIALDDQYKGRAVNFKFVNNSNSNYQYFYYVKVNQCPFVATALTASNITGTTLDLTWESEAANFQVQYGEQGFNVGEGTGVDVNGATTLAISELNYETAYDFYVRVVCEGDNGAWVGPVTVTTAPSCSEPASLSFEMATNMLFWNAGEWGTPVQYNVRYKAEDEEEYTTITVDPVVGVDPFTVISGLNSNTTYEIGVQSICDENQESGWTSIEITTPCMPMSLPYIQDFDSYTGTTTQSTTVVPDCWERKYTGTSTSYGAGIWNASSYAVSGTNSLRMYNYCTTNTSTTYGDLYVILPKFDANINSIMVSFDAKKYNSTSAYYISNYEIGVVTDKTQPEATFTSYRTLSATSATTADKIDVPFDAYNGIDGYIAFRMSKEKPEGYTNSYAYNYVYIDNLNVGPIPTCFVPSIAVEGTTATITPNANGDAAQSYNLKIGDQVVNVTSTPVDLNTLFTLEPQTDYEVSVQTVCGEGNESEWSANVGFTTPCAAMDLPYSQDFENVPTNTLPDCWNKIGAGTVQVLSSTSNSYNSSRYLRFSGNTSNVVALPSFNSNKILLTFYTRPESYTNSSCGSFDVGYIDANNNFTALQTYTYNEFSAYTQKVVEYTNFASTNKIAFRHRPTSTSWYWYVDNINVEVLPTCGVPSISVNGTIATIVPNSIGTAESYDLQLGNAIQTVTSTTVDLMDLFTLESATNYEVSVRANCGEGDNSTWSNPVSFNTPCESTCTYTLSLVDSYGDGWNGNAINVMMNGAVIANMTISSGSEYTGTVSACGEIGFAWVTGSYASETSFTIEDESGNILYTCTNGSSLSNGQVFYSTTCDGAVVTCHAPEQLTVSEISETSATITWVDEHDQNAYTLQYMAENDADWTSVENIDTNYYILTNLTASTEYTVRVKAVCGTDDESDYTLETSFRTNCIGGGNAEIAGTGTNQNYIPVGNYYNYSYTQQILTAEEIGLVGTISSISFEYAYTIATTNKNNVNIYMANTNKSEFASTSDWIAADDMQLVYQGNLNCSEGWNEFALNNTFVYTGGNLAIIVEDNSGAYNGNAYVFATTTTSENRALTWQSDGSAYAGATGTLRQLHSNIRLTVCPEATDLALISLNTIADACDVEGAVTINVKNLGYEGTVSTFEAYYQVNDGTPVHETVTLATPIAMNEDAEYTFNMLPTFATGANFIVAWVEMTGDLVDANNTVTSAPITVLAPATVPYVEAFTGLTINHGWNPIDANNDGITMNLNNDINYTFNDEAAADDWMMSPCIEMAAGTYTIIYDYKANSSLTESFEVFYGNGSHVADMTNAVATHTFYNTTVETATTTIIIPADGIYNFGFHATSLAGNLGFTIDNFKVYPVNDVIVTYNENGGTVTPNGTVAVNYGENLTLNLVPASMYHVAGVWVDSVQVVPEDGTGANFMLYTLENVTEPHTVFVDFKLEFHIFKTVENYRADLYSDLGGAFVPAETDTTINPNPFTVNMVADPHYHMVGLTVSPMVPDMQLDVFDDVVDNGDGTYSYTIDTLVVANYYLNAIFRRDTVAINYNVLTGKGYANDSPLLNTGDTYTTWIDYSVNNDVDTTISFTGHDLYHVADVTVNGTSMGHIDSYTFENVTETQTVDIKFGYKIDASVRNYNTYGDIAMTDPQGTIEPATQYIPEFDPMTVTGTVAEHFHLYQLLVNGENRIDEVVFGADNSYSFSIDSVVENCIIEAVVKVDTFAITYNVLAGQGYADASELLVAGDTYNTIVNYGDNWYSNIVPATGYSIENVLLDGQNLYTASNNQFNFIVESHVFDITFEANTYTITTNAYGAGSVTNGMTFTYDPANPVDYVFNATPEEGYYVSAVIINNEAQDLTGVEGTYTTTIENVADNYVIDVHFSIFTYTMTAEAGEGGTITPAGAQTVNYGTDVTYEINANEGWYIASTDIDGVTTTYTQDDAVVTLTIPYTAINADHNISVTFAQFMYTITATAGTHGTVNGAEAVSANIAYGSNYALTFTPDANYQVADVVVDGVTVGAVDSYEFINVTANHTVEVSFEAIMYTLTATSNMEGCTITPATTTVQAGSNVSYTLSAASGCHLLNVIANGEEVAVTNNAFTITDVQSDYTIFANFAPNYVTVTVNQPAHATITPGTQTYAYGATPSYMIVPEVGYEVVSVTAGNAVVNVTYNNGIGTFTLAALQQDITLTATTSIKKFEITVTQGANGTIAPGTQTNVEYGSNKTFTITPNQYYVIADVIVDGSSRGALSSYTFYNVAGNHTITAVFEANCQTPTNLTAMDIDTSSAVLSWVGTAPSYEVRYKAADAASYTTQTDTTTSLQLTGLTPNTLYEYGVRAICGANLTSDWAINAFTTKALPIGPVDGIANAELSSIKVYSYLNNVYIVNEEGIAISNVDIYDIYGKQVYTGKVINSPEVISLNVANGNYVVRLATENGVGVYKVAIVR